MIARLAEVERRIQQLRAMTESLQAQVAATQQQQWQRQGNEGLYASQLEVRYATNGASAFTVAAGDDLFSGTVTLDARIDGVLTATPQTVTAYCLGAVAASARVLVIGRDGGPWDVIVEICPEA